MLNRKEIGLRKTELISPEGSFKNDCFNSPRYERTGSAFTELRSGESKRSKFTSNSKLTRSNLFKSIKGRASNLQERL